MTMGWIAQLFLVLAAPITALLVTRDAINFSVVQMIVAVILFASLVGVLAFWPRGRSKPTPTE
jgi:hypothetical protein